MKLTTYAATGIATMLLDPEVVGVMSQRYPLEFRDLIRTLGEDSLVLIVKQMQLLRGRREFADADAMISMNAKLDHLYDKGIDIASYGLLRGLGVDR